MIRSPRRAPHIGRRRTATTAAATLLAASLLLAACGGGSAGNAAQRATSTTSSGATSSSTTGGTAPDGPAAPQPSGPGSGPSSTSSPFCGAAAVLQQSPPQNPTPEQIAEYVRSVESAADTMIASVPDRSIVPVVEGLKKAFALYTTLANADPNEDPAQFQAKAEEAERLFPADQQQRFAEYVKAECGIELQS